MTGSSKKVFAMVLAFALMASLMIGCTSKSNDKALQASATPAGTTTSQATAKKETGYPQALTYWVDMNGNVAATLKNYGEIAAYKEVEKATGTKVTFQHPPTGQAKEGFNLMVSTNELPDVIEYNWTTVPKGPDGAIKDKTIIRLNELIEKNAPNLSKLLKDRPDLKKLITTDDGNIYTFPFIRGDDYLLTFVGPTIRKDWLDKLNLPVPTTIDEWHTALKAFKEKDPNGNGKPDEIPFLLQTKTASAADVKNFLQSFTAPWGINADFYQESGIVKYGPIQPGFKEFLKTMNQWFKEGLLDKDFASTDDKLRDAKVTSEQLGAFNAFAGSGIGRYTDLVQPKNPSFKLAGAPYPVLKKGDKPLIGQQDSPYSGLGAAITGSNKHPEETVKWLDYKYSQEGTMLFNFGIEGESYKMVNGYPTYTDLIMNNPNKLPKTQAMARYILANFNGPFVQDKRYQEQNANKPEQIAAINTWKDAAHDRLLPTLTPTAEESTNIARVMNDVNTYLDEMLIKFIFGAEPIDNFDNYVSRIEKMGIQDAVKMKQASLERFKKRN